MNRERRYAAYIGLLLGVSLGLILLALQGCTIYTVDKTGETTKVRVISSRDFEQPELHYRRDAESAEFDFGAATATTESPLEAIGATVIQQMLERYMPLPPLQE